MQRNAGRIDRRLLQVKAILITKLNEAPNLSCLKQLIEMINIFAVKPFAVHVNQRLVGPFCIRALQVKSHVQKPNPTKGQAW